jgi:hypothetical protein
LAEARGDYLNAIDKKKALAALKRAGASGGDEGHIQGREPATSGLSASGSLTKLRERKPADYV